MINWDDSSENWDWKHGWILLPMYSWICHQWLNCQLYPGWNQIWGSCLYTQYQQLYSFQGTVLVTGLNTTAVWSYWKAAVCYLELFQKWIYLGRCSIWWCDKSCLLLKFWLLSIHHSTLIKKLSWLVRRNETSKNVRYKKASDSALFIYFFAKQVSKVFCN